MFRKYSIVLALLLAACGDANEAGLDSGELALFDKAALEQLIHDGQIGRAVDIIRAKEQANIAKTEDYLVLADIYLADLNGVAAQVAVEKARSSGALASQTALPMGSAYMLQRKLQDAKDELRNVKISGPDGFEAVLLQADIAVQEGDIALARKFYGICENMQPQNYRVDLGLALLELGEGDLDAAEAAAITAQSKDATAPMPGYILGSIARMRGEPEKAITLLQGALDLRPRHIHALLELTAAYLDIGDVMKAEAVLDNAVTLAGSYPLTQFYIAFIQAEKGELLDAQEILLRSGEVFSLYPAASRLYGLVTFRLGKYSIAAKFLQQYLSKNPADREVRLALAESLIRSGFPDRSLEVLDPLMADKDIAVDAQAAAGAANIALGNSEAASENYRKAIELASQSDEANAANTSQIKGSLIAAQAIAQYEAGNIGPAIETMSSLESMGLISVEQLTSIANMQLESAQYEDALATAGKLLEMDGENAVAHNIRGAVYYRMNKAGQAIDSLNVALKLKPDYQSAMKNRAYAYSAMGDYRSAKADLKALAAKVENDGQLYAKLGHTHLMLSEFSEAKTALQAAPKLLPQSAVVAANYGYALAQLGAFDEAIAATEVAVGLATFDDNFQKELKSTVAEFKEARDAKEKAAKQEQ
ncbi:tetratricopeptide repeat protein [Kordiimonas sp.]|uniref:tetratricopeptide repeat protein n=1 Tax=Kordiimonas sp. TaxID=1970157 RepID=UPI003A8F1F21